MSVNQLFIEFKSKCIKQKIKISNSTMDYSRTLTQSMPMRPFEIPCMCRWLGSNPSYLIKSKNKVQKVNLILLHHDHGIMILDLDPWSWSGIYVIDGGRSCCTTTVWFLAYWCRRLLWTCCFINSGKCLRLLVLYPSSSWNLRYFLDFFSQSVGSLIVGF